MSFFKTAWHAGAAEYGRARAERYGRWARAAGAIGVLISLLLAVGIVIAVQGGFGG